MSEEHTRGPWLASESDTRPGLWAVWADAGMAGIAQVAIIPNELAHAEGNARLIAKAPDLLAENERLREELSSGSFYKESDIDRLMDERDKLRAENERLREANEAAVEIAETIYHNPAGSLWNYGTAPTAKDRVEWKGAKDTALEILQCLDPDRARAALAEGDGDE